MAVPTYTARGIVLRKTKLGEMDLIVTLLAEDGSQLRAVARGARKPGGSFAGKLELCNTVDLLLSKGRSLDSVKEARLVRSHPAFMADMDVAACASCIAELVERVTQVDLRHERLFGMVGAALDALEGASGAQARYLTAAALLKVFAFTGITPQLSSCAVCGSPLEGAGVSTLFSVSEGGAVCASCRDRADAHPVRGDAVRLAANLLMATFPAVLETEASPEAARDVLELCREWSRFHVGSRIRSLDFLLDSPETPA